MLLSVHCNVDVLIRAGLEIEAGGQTQVY